VLAPGTGNAAHDPENRLLDRPSERRPLEVREVRRPKRGKFRCWPSPLSRQRQGGQGRPSSTSSVFRAPRRPTTTASPPISRRLGPGVSLMRSGEGELARIVEDLPQPSSPPRIVIHGLVRGSTVLAQKGGRALATPSLDFMNKRAVLGSNPLPATKGAAAGQSRFRARPFHARSAAQGSRPRPSRRAQVPARYGGEPRGARDPAKASSAGLHRSGLRPRSWCKQPKAAVMPASSPENVERFGDGFVPLAASKEWSYFENQGRTSPRPPEIDPRLPLVENPPTLAPKFG